MSYQRVRPLERWQVIDLINGIRPWDDVGMAERREAVRLLTEAGRSTAEIAIQLHVTDRTVTRARRALREGTLTCPLGPRRIVLKQHFHVFVPAHVRPLIGVPCPPSTASTPAT